MAKRGKRVILTAESLDYITSSESPSRIKEEHPSSRAREMARAAARASTTFEEKGRGICSDREAMT